MKHQKPIALLLVLLAVFCLCPYASAAYGDACDVPAAPGVSGNAAFMIELTTGTVLYEKNADAQMYPASTTKLMTALVAVEQIEAGKLSLDDVVTFSHEAVYGIPRDTMHISIDVGEELTVRQVLYGMMVASANETCLGIGEHIAGSFDAFADMMNAKAAELGMDNTHFVTLNGLHDPNHYTTPRDLATLMTECIRHELLLDIISTPSFEIPPTNKCAEPRHLTSTNKLILTNSSYYNAKVIGGKTGFTTPAGNTLVTYAEYGGLEYVTVIMKAPQGTTFKDTSALIEHFAANLMLTEVTDTIDLAKSVPTADGSTMLVEPAAFTVLCHASDNYLDYDRVYDLPAKITEPVAAGGKLGILRLYDNGYLVAETDLLARSSYGQPAATSAPVVTSPDGSTIEPGSSSNVGTGDPTASAIVQTTIASTNVQTASPDQDKGSTFVGIMIKFLLILLCVAIFCALIYGIIIMCSIFFYNNNKKKKQSQKKESSHRDDNDPPSMMH
ncbi:MAG: D-alanyl-D-alanine carboxypeptidase [Clostridia bacterium]|nr:D-alanyl-D-alanine carboxypeptidase [Clostridia bacterium]